jgi:hypothetical protein
MKQILREKTTGAARHTHLAALLLMTAILLIAYALRVYRLDAKDIWVDEAHPWWYASLPLLQSVGIGFSGGAINSTADPLYNIVLHFWIELTGSSLFGLRYLSALTNLLGVAYLGRVTARAFKWRAGILAVLVGAIAPVWIAFSQELRPYAFTPAIMLVMVEAVLQITQTGTRRAWPWIWLAVGEAVALYTHGFMVFGVVGINLWLGWLWLRRWRLPDRWLWLRRWAISQIGALALIAPIIPLQLARAGGIQNPFVPPITPSGYANMLWAYFMGIPWENVANFTVLRLLAALVLLLVLMALVKGLRGQGVRPLADLLWLVLGVSALTLLYALRDPSVHPRYVVFLTGPLFMILGVLLAHIRDRSVWSRWSGGLLALALLAISFLSLRDLYQGLLPGYRHPSTRLVTDTLKADFGAPDGIVMVAPHDFTLNYYGIGQAPLAWARFDEGIDTPSSLLSFVRGKQRIALLRNTNERSDSRRIAPFYLERFGALEDRQYFTGYDLSTYRLDAGASPIPAAFEPIDFSWGMLSLTGQSAASGDAVTVALQWAASASFTPGPRYAASMRLVDPITRWTIAGADALLLADNGDPADHWQPGQQATQYFVLPLQPGTPPIDAEIVVTLYDSVTGQAIDLRDPNGNPAGQQAMIGTITLGPAPEQWAYEDQRPWQLVPVEASSIVAGYAIDQSVTSPGGALGVTIGWLLSPEELKDQQVTLQLVQDDQVLAEDGGPVLQGRQPATVPPGQSWLDRRLLEVSSQAQPGPADLMIRVGDERIVLASVEIAGFERITQRPDVEHPLEATFGSAIKLLGYQMMVPDPLTNRDTIPLTLYWQALADGAPGASYKVFTQILSADGRLVGQHDGVPVYENRPFSGWLAGEYIIDEHPMKFNEPYIGPIHIQVGLYDPVTGVRVLTADGRDAVAIPEELQVSE